MVARDVFSGLRAKHPTLKGYLVLARRGGQVEASEGTHKRLAEFPDLYLDTAQRREAQKLLVLREAAEDAAKTAGYRRALAKLGDRHAEMKKAEAARDAERAKETAYRERLDEVIPELLVDERACVELRFSKLEYELVWEIQKDELVDRARTPQTRASIRIVLGTVGELHGRARR